MLNHNWMTGLRKDVFARDGHCVSCKTEEGLFMHCVRPWFRSDVDSWITLCEPCRKKRHNENRATELNAKNPQRRIMARRIEELLKENSELKKELRASKERNRGR